MLTSVFYFYLFILFIMILFNYESKFFCFLGLIISYVIFSGNTLNPDYYTYLQAYQNSSSGIIVEQGWNAIMHFFYSLNFTYNDFLGIVFLLSMILNVKSILKCTKKISIVLFFYMFVFLIIDTIQLRNFFAFSILLYGVISYIYEDKDKKRYIILALSIALASIIHRTSILYCVVFFLDKKEMKYKKIIVLLLVLLTIAIGIIPQIKSILMMIISIFMNSSDTNEKVNLGYIYILMLQIFSYGSLVFYRKLNMEILRNNKIRRFYTLCENLSMLGFLLVPFCMINMNVYRILRYFSILNLILFSTVLSYRQTELSFKQSNLKKIVLSKNYFYSSWIIFFTYITWYYFIYFKFGQYEIIIKTVLENNKFFL